MGIRKDIEVTEINSMYTLRHSKSNEVKGTYNNRVKNIEREMTKGYLKMLSNFK